MKAQGVKKEPGCSWIEVKSKVHKFVAQDGSHQQMEEIHARLEILIWQMKLAGDFHTAAKSISKIVQ